MKSKKWLISLGLAVVLVVAFALPACDGDGVGPDELSLTLKTGSDLMEIDTGQSIRDDLEDFGIHITFSVMDATVFNDWMYVTDKDADLFVGEEEPSANPYADWIWALITDPWGWGEEWAPTYWYDEDFNTEYVELYTAADPTVPRELLQEIANDELPMYMLYRDEVVSAYRTNRWTGWYNELGGPLYWFNPWSIYELHWVGGGGEQRLSVGTQTDVKSLNMDYESLEHSNLGCIYKAMVYETLGAYGKVGDDPDDTNELIPRLATNYTVTNEMRYHPINEVMQMAQVWTVTLREGVKWHDGQDFDSADVLYTFENVLSEWDPAKPICFEDYWETWEPTWWLNVTGTHEIELIYENPITTAHHPSWWCWDCIVPEHIFGPAGNGTYVGWNEDNSMWTGNHTGTGPFKYEEYVAGDYHKWVRNADWWGETVYGPNEIEVLWIQIYPSMESLTASFEADEIDTYMASFSYLSIPDFTADPDITVEVVPGIAIYYLGFDFYTVNEATGYDYYEDGANPAENPLHDVALRKAIAYAVNATRMVDLILGGYGETIDGWVYPEMDGYNDELEMYAQDVIKAAQLLTDAGYTKPGDWWVYPD